MTLLLSILLSFLPLFFLNFSSHLDFFFFLFCTFWTKFFGIPAFFHFFLNLQGTALSYEVYIQLLSAGDVLVFTVCK